MQRSLPPNPCCCLFPSPTCMLHLVICTYLKPSPIAPLLLLHVFILFLYVMLVIAIVFYWCIA